MTGDDDTSHLEDYLDADFIIVDEFSMVDTWLANQLLSNIATDTKLLIVGDADQLPSVSPGQVLADLLQIPSIPQTKLEHIFRQSEDSTIVSLAGDIRQGKLPQDFTERKADRSYFEAGSEHIPKMIEQITSAALRSQIPARDIQVLAPMYKGQAGIDNINTLMQDLLNPAVKDQVVLTRQTANTVTEIRSSIWSMMQKAMSLTEISATSPIFSQENIRNLSKMN